MNEAFGKYELVRKIATGGNAEVFLARQGGDGGFAKAVAIKRMFPHLVDEPDALNSFMDEARIAASFNHPNIVQIFELGQEGDNPFLAMEYVHGKDLGRILRKATKEQNHLPMNMAVSMIASAASGLAYAHVQTDDNGNPMNVVHRDISPQNILVSADGHVKICDFGIAKAEDRLGHTKEGQFKGKIAYMSPEQFEKSNVDSRSDIYALGVVLYETATGRRLYDADNDLEVIRMMTQGDYRKPTEVDPTFPADLEAIILKSIAWNPDERYQTGEDLQLVLEEWLNQNQARVSAVHVARYVRALFPELADPLSLTTESNKAAPEPTPEEDKTIVTPAPEEFPPASVSTASSNQHTAITKPSIIVDQEALNAGVAVSEQQLVAQVPASGFGEEDDTVMVDSAEIDAAREQMLEDLKTAPGDATVQLEIPNFEEDRKELPAAEPAPAAVKLPGPPAAALPGPPKAALRPPPGASAAPTTTEASPVAKEIAEAEKNVASPLAQPSAPTSVPEPAAVPEPAPAPESAAVPEPAAVPAPGPATSRPAAAGPPPGAAPPPGANRPPTSKVAAKPAPAEPTYSEPAEDYGDVEDWTPKKGKTGLYAVLGLIGFVAVLAAIFALNATKENTLATEVEKNQIDPALLDVDDTPEIETVELAFESQPPGAWFVINGVPADKGGAGLKLIKGETNQVDAYLAGHAPKSIRVPGEGGSSPVLVELEALKEGGPTASLAIVTEPRDATIYLDGKEAGKTPTTLVDLRADVDHHIFIDKPERYAYSGIIHLVSNAENLIEAQLPKLDSGRKNYVEVVYSAIPKGTSVSLDGEARGITPFYKNQPRNSRQEVVFDGPDHDTVKQIVSLERVGTIELRPFLPEMKREKGTISISLEPSGGTLFVGSNEYGTEGVQKLELKEGKYDVVVEHLGERLKTVVDVKPKTHTEYVLEFSGSKIKVVTR